MSKFKEYLQTIDKRKKIIGASVVGIAILSIALLIGYTSGSKPVLNSNDKEEPKRELIVQKSDKSDKINKYTGDKKDFHFNKHWKDMSGGVYTISEEQNNTNVQYKKKPGNEWVYMAAPVEGKFSDFNYITLKVKGEKGKKLFLKTEENAVELKAKFFTLNGKEQLLTLNISDVANKSKLDSLKEVMLFASPGEIEASNFTIMDAWFSVESPVVNRYIGDANDFHFNKYWEDIFNHGIAIDEENGTTTMSFTKPKDNNWILASTPVEGKLSDFNYVTLKVKGEAGQKFLLKLEKGDAVYGEKLVDLSGEEEVVIVKLKKDDSAGLDSLKEVRVFPNAGQPENGKIEILDAWFSVEKPQGFKEAGESEASGGVSGYINGWKIEEWTKYIAENVNGLTKVTYNNPAPWANFTYNVEGKINGNNLLNIYLNSNGCDHVMIKLRGKFKYVDPVGGFNVYEEVEVFNNKINQGETNLQVDITDALKELGYVTDVVMFVESYQDMKGLDRVGSLTFGAPKFTSGTVANNSNNKPSDNGWIVEDWTGYSAEVKNEFTRISYDNPAPWANITYNIKNLLKDNDLLELKVNSNGCDHIQVKLRGKYLNSAPGYKVYEEALVFDGKINNGEKTLKIDLKEAINQLGRANITDILMFVESSEAVSGLDHKGILDIYTPVFKKDIAVNPLPENPSEDKNVVINSTFENGLGNWEVFAETGKGDAAGEIKNGAAVIDINSIGTENWNVQFVNKKLKLEKGSTYKYSIKLKSSEKRPVELVIQQNGGSYTIFTTEVKNLTSEYQTFEKSFKYTGESTTDLAFAMNLGKVAGISTLGKHTIYVDEVNLVKVTGGNEEEKPEPEKPEPEKPEVPSEDKNVVINSIFESSLGNWEVFAESGKGDAAGEIKNGAAVIDINSIGTENWNVQFVNKKLKLEKGSTYKYSIKLKSSEKRPVELVIQQNGGSYTTFTNEVKTLTSEYQTFEKEFKYTGESSTNLAFAMNLGKVEGISTLGKHTVYVDEVKLVKVTEGNSEEKPVPEEPQEPKPEEPKPEEPKPEEIVSHTVSFDISDAVAKLGGNVSKIKMFIESNEAFDETLTNKPDKKGTLEIIETSLENKLGDKIKVDKWTTAGEWTGYNISTASSKTIVSYNPVSSWGHIFGEINNYNAEYTNLVFKLNTTDCDYITVTVVGTDGTEVDVTGKVMAQEAKPEPSVPEEPKPEEQVVTNTVAIDISDEVLGKLGGGISNIIMFVESNPYGGNFDRNGTLEIVDTTFENVAGDKIHVGTWTTDAGWNQYQITSDGAKQIVKYNTVQDWANIIGTVNNYNSDFKKLVLKLNTTDCEHVTIKLKGVNGAEEEIKQELLIKS